MFLRSRMVWIILSIMITCHSAIGLKNTVPSYVSKFAPELRFDRAALGYPMSAQVFYEALIKNQFNFISIENTNKSTLATGNIPTYYMVRTIGKQIRIIYWFFYAYQHPCYLSFGSHDADWEHIMVILTEDQSAVAAVSYYQHNDHYTRISGPRNASCTPPDVGRCSGSYGFESEGSHPVAYIARTAHGSYHDRKTTTSRRISKCTYYGGNRNPQSNEDYLQTWNNLIDLDGNQESWIAADRTATWIWGPAGIPTHPTQQSPIDAIHSLACTGTALYSIDRSGCYQSECLSGDHQTGTTCLKECKSNNVDFGVNCETDVSILDEEFDNDMIDSNVYFYNYTLPHQDAGLSRPRTEQNEWNIP